MCVCLHAGKVKLCMQGCSTVQSYMAAWLVCTSEVLVRLTEVLSLGDYARNCIIALPWMNTTTKINNSNRHKAGIFVVMPH